MINELHISKDTSVSIILNTYLINFHVNFTDMCISLVIFEIYNLINSCFSKSSSWKAISTIKGPLFAIEYFRHDLSMLSVNLEASSLQKFGNIAFVSTFSPFSKSLMRILALGNNYCRLLEFCFPPG